MSRQSSDASSVRSLILLAGVICTGAAVTVVSAQTGAVPSVREGAYTEEQAIRGELLYDGHCSLCHGEALSGQDQAPPLAGPLFAAVWDGETLAALVDRIGTMPPDQPGSLSRSDSVDLLTYILWYNGLPIGDAPLSAEQSVLTQTTFQTPPLTDR